MSKKQWSILATLAVVVCALWALIIVLFIPHLPSLFRPEPPAVAGGSPTPQMSTIEPIPETPEPSPPSGKYIGKIGYVSRSADDDEEIWIMNADGTNPVRLTTGAWDENPAWSPDGSKIAFDTDRNTTNARRVFVMNADGTGFMPLTSDQWDNVRPAWSPDGRMIAFSSQQDNAAYGLYIMESGGRNITRLFSGQFEDHPSWSPDGSKIAFQRRNPDDIYAVDLDKGTIMALTTTGMESEPEWSPDGSRIVFTSRRDRAAGGFEIYVMNSDGSNPVNLTRHPAWDFMPTWSPDGTRLAFVSNRDGNLEIYVMNADGTGLTRLTYNTENDFAPDWIY